MILEPIASFIYCYYSRLPWPDPKTIVSTRDSHTADNPLDRSGTRKGAIQGICYQK